MTQHRALEWLHLYGRRYPWAWESYARLLADPPAQWPSWCWCPLAGAYAVISRGEAPPLTTADVSALGALAAWRATQGIYRVHPTLLAELLATPISGDLPTETLLRLPEWCVYIETPGHVLWGEPLHGYWAHLEHDVQTARRELRIVLDIDARELAPVLMHLGGSLQDGLALAVRESRVQALRTGHAAIAPSFSATEIQRITAGLSGLVSVLLYLCADEAEIDDLREPPPKVVRGAKRLILPAARAPVVHETGVRLGSALDAARARAERADGTGAAVTPHVRRAHWHAYWTGPRDGERRISLRWLSPILVGFEGAPEEATVRPVNGVD